MSSFIKENFLWTFCFLPIRNVTHSQCCSSVIFSCLLRCPKLMSVRWNQQLFKTGEFIFFMFCHVGQPINCRELPVESEQEANLPVLIFESNSHFIAGNVTKLVGIFSILKLSVIGIDDLVNSSWPQLSQLEKL